MRPKPDWTKAASLPPDELARLLEEDHDEIDDNPELTDEQLAALRPAAEVLPPEMFAALSKRRPGQRGPGKRPARIPVTLRIDPAALDAWRGSGSGWQSRINDLITREAPKARKRA